MKNKLLIFGLLTIFVLSSCNKIPKPEKILKKSFDKCQTIENGYYEMEHYMKYMSNKDTTLQIYNCYFNKLKDDSIYSSAFHYQMFSENEYKRDVLYTGDDFVNYSEKDSTGKIMSKKLWAKDIKSYSHNYTFYSPLINKESYPLPKDSDFIDKKNIFEYIGEETINNIPCYHIRKSIIPENDSSEMMKTLRTEINYWINKQDYIPIQYSIAIDLVMNNDTMYQFEKNNLTKYALNNLKDETQLKLASVPSYINLKDYKPYKSPELLSKDTIAPNWSLISLKDKTINLSDYKGKLVLIDFFYKSCYPCMLALPALQNLHEKYNGKGLEVIGIDPYDTKEKDDIANFLAKRGVTYTVLLGGKDVAKEYHVSGYPTMYLIDKNGKIILSQVGYGEGVEEELEKIIKENLL
jgi:thiol-disulfide isomerase/thioredoxin